MLENALVEFPPELQKLLDTPESFYDLRYGAIARSISAVKLNGGKGIAALRIEHANLLLDAMPMAVAVAECDIILEAFCSRRIIEILENGRKALASSPEEWPFVIDEIKVGFQESRQSNQSDLPKIVDAAEFVARAFQNRLNLSMAFYIAGQSLPSAVQASPAKRGVCWTWL